MVAMKVQRWLEILRLLYDYGQRHQDMVESLRWNDEYIFMYPHPDPIARHKPSIQEEKEIQRIIRETGVSREEFRIWAWMGFYGFDMDEDIVEFEIR